MVCTVRQAAAIRVRMVAPRRRADADIHRLVLARHAQLRVPRLLGKLMLRRLMLPLMASAGDAA